jgi:hypothetical protein
MAGRPGWKRLSGCNRSQSFVCEAIGTHARVSGTSFGPFLKKTMLTVLLILAGLVCFGLFFKSIDFFDKI